MNNEPLPNERGQLRKLLSLLPDVPVSSNFTARVMQAVELDQRRRPSWRILEWDWRVFLPRVTVTAMVAALAVVAVHQYDVSAQRENVARYIAAQPMPSVEALQNFDAIRRMGQTARPDDELLALASDMK